MISSALASFLLARSEVDRQSVISAELSTDQPPGYSIDTLSLQYSLTSSQLFLQLWQGRYNLS